MFNFRKKPEEKKLNVRTQVCVIMDQSGSMESRKAQTISGYNEFLQSLKKNEGDEVFFTLALFSSEEIETRYLHKPIAKVPELTGRTYVPNGGTPLYDAIGSAITEMEKVATTDELVMIAIMTDGEENSSKEYRLDVIKSMIQKHEKAGWKFVFLGVGIDGFAVGQSLGMSASSSFSVHHDNAGLAYKTMASNMSGIRSTYVNLGIGATACMNAVTEDNRISLKKENSGT
jgi:uncharacterized protein YegL